MSNAFRHAIAGLDTFVPTRVGEVQYINFDNAASTPPLAAVMQAVNDTASWYAAVHRGSGFKSRWSTRVYEEARWTVGRFFGAHPSEHTVIFGKNTTEAINKLSYRLGLRKTDIVLISHLEHHSNDLPWRAQATVKLIGLTADGGINKESYLSLLQRYKERVKLVAVSGASNVTGHIPDIHWFARQAHAAGAQIMVDCAQLAAHRPINIGRLDDPVHLDYIAISGHKMYAPFGTGALIGRRDTFARGAPEYSGGGTIEVVTAQAVDWALPPDSDEAGSPNVIGAVALAKAVTTLASMGLDAVAQHEADITAHALTRLSAIPGVRVFGDTDSLNTATRSGVVPFVVGAMPAHLVAAILSYEWGIGVRSGCFCAQPYVMSLLKANRREQERIRRAVLSNQRDTVPGLVRASFGLYNTLQEVEVFADAITAIAQGEHGDYRVDPATGYYTPYGAACDVHHIAGVGALGKLVTEHKGQT